MIRLLTGVEGEAKMNPLALQLFLVAVMTLTALHWEARSQTMDAAQEQAANSRKVEEEKHTLGADQANKVANTGVDVTETTAGHEVTRQQELRQTIIIDTESSDPRSERNFSFDTEKDPAAASDTKN
jgi:hypothetical protein